ncbi:unnamed protein product [Brassicogethes aeneus]|uniref:RUN domain-containing protein n=1 Tax=Brassicogethes aeneus TaxID=1431903 RepID=A0A9P0BCI0_BRAAE|nr:unnamed protein product [Brassicogethes aeneus]
MLNSNQPPGVRLDPIGAPNNEILDDKPNQLCCDHAHVPLEKLTNLQEENELLNSSLFALTTHFAQVQFRLRQVVSSSDGDENVLKALEDFASTGIPDVGLIKERENENTLSEEVRKKRAHQRKLLQDLKQEFCGLKQDALKKKEEFPDELYDKFQGHLNLSRSNYKRTPKDFSKIVDKAWKKLEKSSKTKDYLISELKVQLEDLERFIKYLQENKLQIKQNEKTLQTKKVSESLSLFQTSKSIIRMVFAVYGYDRNKYFNGFKLNKRNNVSWIDLRIKLEESIIKIKEVYDFESEKEYDYVSDEEHCTVKCNVALLTAIRQELIPSIRDLIEHGSANLESTMVPIIGCIPWLPYKSNTMHAWDIILKYYKIKNGEQYNLKPSRKLSNSFNLNIEKTLTETERILKTIGKIIDMHAPYKRKPNMYFKSFISEALNNNKLSLWMNIIFQNGKLIKSCYLAWSYVSQTRFQDVLGNFDNLKKFNFNLPINLAVKQFEEIEDVI